MKKRILIILAICALTMTGCTYGEIGTLNGCHLITPPFNLQEFRKRFPDVEVKKNGLTALYVPQSITAAI